MTVTIDMDMTVFINNAIVTVADIEAGNGVVHVIDAVLLPPATTTCDQHCGGRHRDTINEDCDCVGEAIEFATVVDSQPDSHIVGSGRWSCL